MKTIAPFLLSIFLPGLGHLIVKRYIRGLLIMLLTIALVFYIPLLAYLMVLIALVDLYYIMEKEHGRKAASRRLFFSILLSVIIIPGLIYAFGISLLLGTEMAANHYFNERNTASEMEEIAGALESYRSKKGHYPPNFDEFVNSKPIWKNWRTDFWNNPYQYQLKDSLRYQLLSAGEDQQYGTGDDIVLPKETKEI